MVAFVIPSIKVKLARPKKLCSCLCVFGSANSSIAQTLDFNGDIPLLDTSCTKYSKRGLN